MENLYKEYNIKKNRLSNYLLEKKLEGVLLAKRSNYEWLMCGRTNRIVDASEAGSAALLFDKDKLYLLTTNVEIERMKKEEVNDFDFLECIQYNWFEPQDLGKKISEIVNQNAIQQDAPVISGVNFLSSDFNRIKYCMTGNEKERYYELGKVAARCMSKVCRSIKVGMSELEVHGLLSQNLLSEGIIPTLILVGADERLLNYRHPISTNKKIEKYVMTVASASKWGLQAAITRIVHFGSPSSEILKARDIITSIDSQMILSSRPGVKYSDIFKNERKAFEKHGLKNEWMNHHQGGPIGYEGRYFCVSSESEEIIENNHAIAWNPSMRGFKSEDTFIVEEKENRIVTHDESWPSIKVETDYGTISRPDILVV